MESQARSSGFGRPARTGFRKAILQSVLITLITWFGGPTPSAAREPDGDNDCQLSTVDDFLRLTVGPMAIGVGSYNPVTNSGLPIDNSVKLAYSLGARVVEVDVQLTQDGNLAVFHDDFLSDFTCIHSLTLDQLQARLPSAPELQEVLDVPRHVNQKPGDDLGGILIVELKAFSPHGDPADEQRRGFRVGATYSLGMRAFADPANTERNGTSSASLGVDAIYSAISHGCKSAAADSWDLSASLGFDLPRVGRGLSGIAKGITSLPLCGSVKGLFPAEVHRATAHKAAATGCRFYGGVG